MALSQFELSPDETTLQQFQRWASHSRLLAPKTIADRTLVLRYALRTERFWFPQGMLNATSKEVKRYVDSTRNTAATRNAVRLALISFFEYAREFEYRVDNPALDLPTWKPLATVPRPLLPSQAKLLLGAAGNHSPEADALVAGYLYVGFRLTEWADREWADLTGNRVYFSGKGNIPQVRFLNSPAMERVDRLRRVRRSKRHIFPGRLDPNHPMTRRIVYKLIVSLGDSVGIDGCNPHRLRHTFAQKTYDETGDIHWVQRALGHSNIQNTLKYARHSQRGIEEVLETLSY